MADKEDIRAALWEPGLNELGDKDVDEAALRKIDVVPVRGKKAKKSDSDEELDNLSTPDDSEFDDDDLDDISTPSSSEDGEKKPKKKAARSVQDKPSKDEDILAKYEAGEYKTGDASADKQAARDAALLAKYEGGEEEIKAEGGEAYKEVFAKLMGNSNIADEEDDDEEADGEAAKEVEKEAQTASDSPSDAPLPPSNAPSAAQSAAAIPQSQTSSTTQSDTAEPHTSSTVVSPPANAATSSESPDNAEGSVAKPDPEAAGTATQVADASKLATAVEKSTTEPAPAKTGEDGASSSPETAKLVDEQTRNTSTSGAAVETKARSSSVSLISKVKATENNISEKNQAKLKDLKVKKMMLVGQLGKARMELRNDESNKKLMKMIKKHESALEKLDKDILKIEGKRYSKEMR